MNTLLKTVQGSSTQLGSLMEFEHIAGLAEGKSDSTIDLTILVMRKLEAFLKESGLSSDAALVTADDMRNFIVHLQNARAFTDHPYAKVQERVLSDKTVNCYTRSLRAAWNRWVREGLVISSPFSKVKVPKASEKVIPAFSSGQIKALLGAINTSTACGFRDHTMICLYLDTACRLGELTGLRMDDLNLKERCLKVKGKGGRERVVPFGIKASKSLWKYIKMYRPEPMLPQQDYVFLTKDGKRLTNNRMQAKMKKYGRKAEITGVRCSIHTLRHTACLMWIRNGGDIFTLQKVTGHSSLEVLRGYVNLAQSDVATAHKKFSPLDNLG